MKRKWGLERILPIILFGGLVCCSSDIEDPPGTFQITSPIQGALGEPTSPTIEWVAADRASNYLVQIYVLDINDNEWVLRHASPKLSAETLNYNLTAVDLGQPPVPYPWFQASVIAMNGGGSTAADGDMRRFHSGDYPLFSNGDVSTGFGWISCPEENNDSGISGDSLLLETQNNCSVSQYIYFEMQDAGVNFSPYTTGTITFSVEASNIGQGVSFLIQDTSTVTSPTTSLSTYGFDPGIATVPQSIAIPVADLAAGEIDLEHILRPVQFIVTCPTSDCFTKFRDIYWRLP